MYSNENETISKLIAFPPMQKPEAASTVTSEMYSQLTTAWERVLLMKKAHKETNDSVFCSLSAAHPQMNRKTDMKNCPRI